MIYIFTSYTMYIYRVQINRIDRKKGCQHHTNNTTLYKPHMRVSKKENDELAYPKTVTDSVQGLNIYACKICKTISLDTDLNTR